MLLYIMKAYSDFIFRACSQKLTAWQEETGELGLEKLKLSRSAKEHKKPKQQEPKANHSKIIKAEQRSVANLDLGNPNTGKIKRRRWNILSPGSYLFLSHMHILIFQIHNT